MTRNFRKRLQKLKSQIPPIPPQPTDQERRDLYWGLVERLAVEFYLRPEPYRGCPSSFFDPLGGYALALGYANRREWEDAVRANDPKVRKREAQAKVQLFAKFGVSWNEASASERLEALKRMRDGLPEGKRKIMLQLTGHNGD